MKLFADIEKTIESSFRRWTERAFGPAQADDLVLLHRAILEQVEAKVQILGRGQRVFPYRRLTLTLVSPDPDRRALYQTALGERLQAAIREALQAAQCEVPRSFAVEVHTAEAGAEPFTIDYGTDLSKPAPGRLIVLRGKAQADEFTLLRPRTNIGRLAELTDSEHREVAFEEGADESNATVSRHHAHILSKNGEYRICDDGSEFGTRILRDGRSIEVPKGNRRGERLRNGDEIYLGRACFRFEQ